MISRYTKQALEVGWSFSKKGSIIRLLLASPLELYSKFLSYQIALCSVVFDLCQTISLVWHYYVM